MRPSMLHNGFDFDEALVPTIDLDRVDLPQEHVSALVDGFAEYVAALLSVRCELSIVHSSRLACTAGARPLQEVHLRCNCPRCMGAIRRCFIQEGPRVYSTLYRSSNPTYRLTEEAKVRVERLRKVEHQTLHALALCVFMEETSRHARMQFENMHIPREHLPALVAYTQTTRYGSFRCGGIGFLVWQAVWDKAYTFLCQVDSIICRSYNVARNASEQGELRIKRVFDGIASKLANRISLVDDPEAPGGLDVATCEGINAKEYARCKTASDRDIAQSRRVLTDLLALASGVDESRIAEILSSGPRERARLVDALDYPSAEMMLAMDDLDLNEDMLDFALLRAAISTTHPSTSPVEVEVRLAVLTQWQTTERNGARMHILCTRAMNHLMANDSTRISTCFINMASQFDPESGVLNPSLVLPPNPWCYASQRWKLHDVTVHLKRRVRLDSVGLRIVGVSSFMWQMLGEVEAPNIEDGTFSPVMLHSISSVQLVTTRLMLSQIQEDIGQLLIGEEFRETKEMLLDWKSSHFEDHVKAGLANLSNFNVEHILHAFHPKSKLRLEGRLVEKVLECLPNRTHGQFRQFVSPILDVLLNVVVVARTSAGLGLSATGCDAVVEHCAANRHIREWNRQDELRLSKSQVSPSFCRLLQMLASQRKFVTWGRPYVNGKRTNWCFTFSTVDLKRALGAYDTHQSRIAQGSVSDD